MTVEYQAFFTRVQVRWPPPASLALAAKIVQHRNISSINDDAAYQAELGESAEASLKTPFLIIKNCYNINYNFLNK